MYTDTLNKVRDLIEIASRDKSTIFVATISPDGNNGNATFYGDETQMTKLLISLVKLADQRSDGAILKDVFVELFSQGILEIE